MAKKVSPKVQAEVDRLMALRIKTLEGREAQLKADFARLTQEQNKLSDDQHKFWQEMDKVKAEAAKQKPLAELGEAVEKYHTAMVKMEDRIDQNIGGAPPRWARRFMMGPYGW